MRLLLCNWIKM